MWNNKETSTGKSVQFLSNPCPPPHPGGRSWIVDVPFQTGLVVWLLKAYILLYPLRSAPLDNDFVDEEDEARSSSDVLILALGYEIPATLEPHLEQNLSPRFTLAY